MQVNNPRAITMPQPMTFGAPWAITAEGWQEIVSRSRESLRVGQGTPHKTRPAMETRDGVALISMSGPLVKDPVEPYSWAWWMGASSMHDVVRDAEAFRSDAGLHTAILVIDSPGGECAGCSEASAFLYSLRASGKKIIAYVNGMMCSAAYWIGSAVDEIVIDPTAMIGSIGVRTTLTDASELYENIGIRQYDLESEQSPHKVTDPSKRSDRERVRATLTAMCDVFLSDVARNRGVPKEIVQTDFGGGDVFIGKAAIDAGLADRLGSLEEIISSAGGSLAPTKGKATMAKQANPSGASATVEDQKCKGCASTIAAKSDMYCTKCWDDEEDEDDDESDAKKALLALTGAQSYAVALATVTGWKAAATEVARIKAEQAQREETEKKSAADRAEAERVAVFAAKIKAATDAKFLEPHENGARRQFAASCKTIAQLDAFITAVAGAPLVPTAPAHEPEAGSAPTIIDEKTITLDAKELALAAKMSISVEEMKKNKLRLMQRNAQRAALAGE